MSFNRQNPIRAKRRRHRAIRHLEYISENIRSTQIELTDSLSLWGPARKLHIPLIQSLAGKLGYADKSLATDLVRGMPIVGVVPRNSSLPAKDTKSAMILPDVRWAVRDTNMKVLKSLSESTAMLLKQK